MARSVSSKQSNAKALEQRDNTAQRFAYKVEVKEAATYKDPVKGQELTKKNPLYTNDVEWVNHPKIKYNGQLKITELNSSLLEAPTEEPDEDDSSDSKPVAAGPAKGKTSLKKK